MTNVANCKKCGKLFLQASNRNICDACFEEQNKTLSEMNTYVLCYPEPTISLEAVLEKYNMPYSEFETLFIAGKFVKIAQKVTMVCSKCGSVVPIAGKHQTLCPDCARKIQNEL